MVIIFGQKYHQPLQNLSLLQQEVSTWNIQFQICYIWSSWKSVIYHVHTWNNLWLWEALSGYHHHRQTLTQVCPTAMYRTMMHSILVQLTFSISLWLQPRSASWASVKFAHVVNLMSVNVMNLTSVTSLPGAQSNTNGFVGFAVPPMHVSPENGIN